MYSYTPCVWCLCVPGKHGLLYLDESEHWSAAQVNSWKFEKRNAKQKAMLMDHDRQYVTGLV
jgi:hypothetical protein